MRKVMVVLGAIVLAWTLTVSGWAFDAQKALEGQVTKQPQRLACGPGHQSDAVIARVVTENEGTLYTIFFNVKTKMAIIVKHDAEGNPVEVAFGKLVAVAGKEIVTFVEKAMMNAEEAVAAFPDPCDYLAPAEA